MANCSQSQGPELSLTQGCHDLRANPLASFERLFGRIRHIMPWWQCLIGSVMHTIHERCALYRPIGYQCGVSCKRGFRSFGGALGQPFSVPFVFPLPLPLLSWPQPFSQPFQPPATSVPLPAAPMPMQPLSPPEASGAEPAEPVASMCCPKPFPRSCLAAFREASCSNAGESFSMKD